MKNKKKQPQKIEHSLGLKEKKKAKCGCKWHPSFPKTQPCFYCLKFQLPLPNSGLHKLKRTNW